jgi:hypothetical protein
VRRESRPLHPLSHQLESPVLPLGRARDSTREARGSLAGLARPSRTRSTPCHATNHLPSYIDPTGLVSARV